MKTKNDLSDLGKSIIRTLSYYDIFNYPLTAEELFQNLDVNHTSFVDVKQELSQLCSINVITSLDKFYMISIDNTHIERRIEGNKLAEKRMRSARIMSKMISLFPYVKGILLSGSISKGFMEKDSDIDYFIITEPGRLWLTRLMLMLFKKLFLLNSKKLFCINYFVDTESLEIEEKNIFTAIELATLIPTYGAAMYNELYMKNSWIKSYLPNFPKRETNGIKNKSFILKKTAQHFLNNKFGDKLDDFSMRLFEKSNRKKYKDFNSSDFQVAFKTSKKESKHHPKFFQKKVLNLLSEKLSTFEKVNNTSLSR